jgi:chaperonin GroEL
MLEEDIFNPAKATCMALQNAASVAGLLLTTEVMIAEAPKDDDHAHGGEAPAGLGGMGGMDM